MDVGIHSQQDTDSMTQVQPYTFIVGTKYVCCRFCVEKIFGKNYKKHGWCSEPIIHIFLLNVFKNLLTAI